MDDKPNFINLKYDNALLNKSNNETIDLINNNKDLKEYLISFNVSKDVILNSLPAIKRYYFNVSKCKNCDGLLNCKKEDKGISSYLSLTYDGKSLEDNLCPCKYLRVILNLLKNIQYCSYDRQDCFEKYYQVGKAIKNNSNVDTSFVYLARLSYSLLKGKYTQDNFVKGLYLVSENLNAENLFQGMTFLAAKMNVNTAIAKASDLFNNLASCDHSIVDEALEILEKIKDVPILFLTELGFEKKSTIIKDTYLIPFLMSRQGKGKITFISSFYSINELGDLYYKDRKSKELLSNTLNKIVEERKIIDIPFF